MLIVYAPVIVGFLYFYQFKSDPKTSPEYDAPTPPKDTGRHTVLSSFGCKSGVPP